MSVITIQTQILQYLDTVSLSLSFSVFSIEKCSEFLPEWMDGLVSGAQRQHSLLKAMIKHDQAWSIHWWVTVSCYALCADCGQFAWSQNSVQTLYPTKVLWIRL